MKKIILASVILLILNACQGRDMPMHPSQVFSGTSDTYNTTSTIIKKVKKPKVRKQKIIKKQIKRTKKSLKKEKKFVFKTKKIFVPNKVRRNVVKAYKKLPPSPQLPKEKITNVKKHITPKLMNLAVDNIIKKVSQPKESFSGGGIANGLDMATIRIGKSVDYTSIIFDSYIYEGKDTLPSKKSPASGTYLFTYTPSKNQIIGLLDGYHAFSALLSDQKALFSDNDVVENIYVLKRMGTDGIKFVIQLSKKVRANIFDVKNPGRIIVNLFPL